MLITQGYWVCTLLGLFNLFLAVAVGEVIVGVLGLLLYWLGGVGVRERSRYAAAVVFAVSLFEMLVNGVGVVRVLFTALLLSNLRATWIASGWKPESEEASLPPRLGETWADKFVDQLPAWLWPKVRILYYIFSGCVLAILGFGFLVMIAQGER